jgi:hypothetical protein
VSIEAGEVHNNSFNALVDKEEKLKAGIHARVEHPFRLIKRLFGYATVRPEFEEKHAAVQDAVCTVPACGRPGTN